ncbi:MAG: hypothetical protein IPP90_14965 [Gemmatimonadaceae bacterium]|nr:hypothetical protein [Gemmatimonadaceae bacterium]
MIFARIGGAALALLSLAMVRDALVARRAGQPWRGKAVTFGACIVFGINKLIFAGDPDWLDWSFLLFCLGSVVVGMFMSRAEARRLT